MSDLSVSISSSGLVGLEAEKVSAQAVSDKTEVEQPNTVIKAAEVKSAQEKKALPQAEVDAAVEEVNAFVQSMQRNLSFTVDEQLGQQIISVTDAETNEVIRQIPSEELVVLRKKMDDVAGILFDTKV